ncbi:hypothetical protein CMV_002785 [Castanea mollissima]|uniref:40S ribosomal protein S21 n=1 Tax=Castanea mollissima TaxID=60419 RepID=A0A8J4RVJ6_9ROSI|nr:hypothetical protein CMV_002785 [Castanea mollissima]
MQNEEGVITELYIPRKCSATNRLITAKDHASVQINVGHLDENGVYNGHFSTFALCGFVRAQGDADSGLDRLWQKKKAERKDNCGCSLMVGVPEGKDRFKDLPTSVYKLLLFHLKKLVASRKLVKVKNSFELAPTAPVKKSSTVYAPAKPKSVAKLKATKVAPKAKKVSTKPKPKDWIYEGLKIPMPSEKNANSKRRKSSKREKGTLPEDKWGSGTTPLQCWEYRISGFPNGFQKKAAVVVVTLRNKNSMQRKGLSVNFNFLGFEDKEEEEHEFESIGAVNVKEFIDKG